jgi:hypothetical protein
MITSHQSLLHSHSLSKSVFVAEIEPRIPRSQIRNLMLFVMNQCTFLENANNGKCLLQQILLPLFFFQ